MQEASESYLNVFFFFFFYKRSLIITEAVCCDILKAFEITGGKAKIPPRVACKLVSTGLFCACALAAIVPTEEHLRNLVPF